MKAIKTLEKTKQVFVNKEFDTDITDMKKSSGFFRFFAHVHVACPQFDITLRIIKTKVIKKLEYKPNHCSKIRIPSMEEQKENY